MEIHIPWAISSCGFYIDWSSPCSSAFFLMSTSSFGGLLLGHPRCSGHSLHSVHLPLNGLVNLMYWVSSIFCGFDPYSQKVGQGLDTPVGFSSSNYHRQGHTRDLLLSWLHIGGIVKIYSARCKSMAEISLDVVYIWSNPHNNLILVNQYVKIGRVDPENPFNQIFSSWFTLIYKPFSTGAQCHF